MAQSSSLASHTTVAGTYHTLHTAASVGNQPWPMEISSVDRRTETEKFHNLWFQSQFA
jgi:hypothetical protein